MRGQVLPLLAIALVLLLVLTGVVVDGSLLMLDWWTAQEDLDAECIRVATGGPFEMNGTIWTDGSTLRAESFGSAPTYFLQLIGINEVAYEVRSRCLVPRASLMPIAVKRPWVSEGLVDKSLTYGILGQEKDQCDDCKGADYAGAVVPNVVCANETCDPRYFYGIEEAPSPNILKSVIEDLIRGDIRSPLHGAGVRVPQVSGVSNKFLVKAVADTHSVGDHLVVMIFDGAIADAQPWENLELESYAVVEIADLSDVNTLWVTFVRELSVDEVTLLVRARTVSWTWIGD